MSTAWEQFQGATLMLARSGSIKDRLADAFRNHLSQVHEEELPGEIRAQFCSVRSSLTRERPMSGEDAVRASVRKLSSREAEYIAESVVEMLAAIPRSPVRGNVPASLYLVEA